MSRKYRVVSGDTLFKVAKEFYGDGNLYTALAVINHLTYPYRLVVGQWLEIP